MKKIYYGDTDKGRAQFIDFKPTKEGCSKPEPIRKFKPEYTAFAEQKTRTGAETFCKEKGGRLAQIYNYEEDQLAWDKLKELKKTS